LLVLDGGATLDLPVLLSNSVQEDTKQLLTTLPVAIGVVGSMLFVRGSSIDLVNILAKFSDFIFSLKWHTL
jgi:hypothetical protein